MCKTRNHKKPIEFEVNMPHAPGAPALVIVKREVPSCVKGMKRTLEVTYWVEAFEAAYGLGYRFRKGWDGADFVQDDDGDSVHDVNLDPRRGMHECDCRGFQRWQHCKHVDAAIELFQIGFMAKVASQA